MTRWREVLAGVAAFFAALAPARRRAVLAGGAGAVLVVAALAWWVQRPIYRPLFTNLTPADVAAIAEVLDAERVSYRLAAAGRAVLVPIERVHPLRLTLASRGLPAHGGVGVETAGPAAIRPRALEDELARTIGALDGVASARVRLALPERGTPERRPSASVVVTRARGGTLARAQVDGIVRLLAASVDGLAPEAVTVLDESGGALTAPPRPDDALGDGAIAYQRTVERDAEERIESLLGTVVGPGRVIARVAAAVDFSRTERTEETYDPDGTVVRESHATREGGAAAGSGRTGGERRDETRRFEVSKTISRTVAPFGAVKSLSIAVLVDGTYRDEAGGRVFVPRTEAELERLRALVAGAVGLVEARGDRLELTSAPFQTPEPAAPPGLLAAVPAWVPALVARALAALVVLAVLVAVVRPLTAALVAAPRTGGPRAEGEGAGPALARENVTLVRAHPERAAELVRHWLAESARPAA